MSPTLMDLVVERADWPGHQDLPDDDGSSMPNMHQPPQTEILSQALEPRLNQIHPDGRYCMAGDSFIYFSYTQPVLDGCKAPDWFYVPGVDAVLHGAIRRSYVLWRELVRPRVVIEYVSGTGAEEHDQTPNSGKFWVYERAIAAEYYVIFDPERATLEVFQLVQGRYQPVAPNAAGRFLVAPLGVEFGIWHGPFRNLSGCWLRPWCATSGQMLPLESEAHQAALQRIAVAEAHTQLVKEQIARTEEKIRLAAEKTRFIREKTRQATLFAEKLRAMGIDPNSLLAS